MQNPKQQVEKLIDILADKTLSFGSKVKDSSGEYIVVNEEEYGFITIWNGSMIESRCKYEFDSLGHDIFIGDVLKLMSETGARDFPNDTENTMKLVGLWEKCGIDKPLQTLIKESGWESLKCNECGGTGKTMRRLENANTNTNSVGKHDLYCLSCCGDGKFYQLKNPQTRELINFLIEKFNV
jgi:hypothetical protein